MTINRDNKITDWNAGVRPKVERLNAEFPTLAWGTYGGHHPTPGRASDGMVPNYKTKAGNTLGWKAARWAWANRKSLGIWYVIFDGRWITETDGANAQWKTYYPAKSALHRPDSAYHRDHVHVSFYDLPAPVKYLPVYVVDPEKISTTLTANAPTGKTDQFRPPGFRITTGVKIDGKWLVTEAGYAYHTDYLVLESEFKARPPKAEEPEPAPVVIDRDEVRTALEGVAGLAAVEGTITALLDALDAEAKSRGFEVSGKA